MTSNDTGVYLCEDVFNARMDAFMAEIRLGNERLRNELNAKIEGNQARNEQQFTEIHDEFKGLLAHMDSVDMRITDLQNTMSLGFMLMAVVIAVSGIMTGACIVFAPSIWGYIGRKRRSKQLRNTATR